MAGNRPFEAAKMDRSSVGVSVPIPGWGGEDGEGIEGFGCREGFTLCKVLTKWRWRNCRRPGLNKYGQFAGDRIRCDHRTPLVAD